MQASRGRRSRRMPIPRRGALDELGERVRIFKACSRVEARHPEKFLSPWTRPSMHLFAAALATTATVEAVKTTL
jgi:hypothetical protein